MMLVETYVAPSPLEGVGVFAAGVIPAGSMIWKLDESWDRIISAHEILALPTAIRSFLRRYAYAAPTADGAMVLESDNGRFMNHSQRPNTDFTDPFVGYAIVDIQQGEEITCDYSEFDPEFEMMPPRHFVLAED